MDFYKRAQWEKFPDEMKHLTNGQEVSTRSHLRCLMSYLDEHGVMRSRGRLENITTIADSTRKPIILPQKSRIARLIVRHYHEKYLHQADNVVIAAIRQSFWIVRLKLVLRLVKG